MCESQSPQHTPYFHPEEMEDRPYGNGIVDGGANGNNVSQLHNAATPHSTSASDSSMSRPPPPQDTTCVVCQDEASGNHYGAWTCEGCKAFFHRSVSDDAVYECENANNCALQRTNTRSRCRACRMKMCLAKGMEKTRVRVGVKNQRRTQQRERTRSNKDQQAKKKRKFTEAGCLAAATAQDSLEPQSGAVMDHGRRAVEVPQRPIYVQGAEWVLDQNKNAEETVQINPLLVEMLDRKENVRLRHSSYSSLIIVSSSFTETCLIPSLPTPPSPSPRHPLPPQATPSLPMPPPLSWAGMFQRSRPCGSWAAHSETFSRILCRTAMRKKHRRMQDGRTG